MESIPYSQMEKGTLLIASPDIENGLFFRGVILVCEHNPNGSFGLVINKELDLQLPQEIINTEQTANPNVSIHAGGPMQTNQMMLLHNSYGIPQQTLKICDGVYLGGDLQFLQESLNNPDGPHLHLCFGYTGWAAGQLEREFLDGNWYLWPANQQHIFNIPPDKLWPHLLREMGGRYASLSMIPEDLSLN
jgi:putative transcriptional regulator